MQKSSFLLLIASAALPLAACNPNEDPVNRDSAVAGEEPTIESPGVLRNEDRVLVSFSNDESPQLIKWTNGRVFVTCPPGYRFEVMPGYRDGSPFSFEEATCEPNPSADAG